MTGEKLKMFSKRIERSQILKDLKLFCTLLEYKDPLYEEEVNKNYE